VSGGGWKFVPDRAGRNVVVGKESLDGTSGFVPEVAHSRACLEGVVWCHWLPYATVGTGPSSVGAVIVGVDRTVGQNGWQRRLAEGVHQS
jgi:hypothetical protein